MNEVGQNRLQPNSVKMFQEEYVAMLKRGMVEHDERFFGEMAKGTRTLLAPFQGATEGHGGSRVGPVIPARYAPFITG